ncbi:MAG: iron ABC transporter permease [Oscillospiraceae bacterium]|nr:iron ABC transporter permease [Oscillospiraceae bacterium]
MEKKTGGKSYGVKWLILCLIFVAAVVIAFTVGRFAVSPTDFIKILLSRVMDIPQTWDSAAEAVILNYRPPRIIAAIVIGAGLAVAGVSYQGMFRNPMVSPDVLGASSGAAFGAALGIYVGMGWGMISVLAFVLGLGAVMLAYGISRVYRGDAVLGLVLAGIMISTLFSSGTSFIKLIADTDNVLPAITYWLMGSLASIRVKDLLPGLIPIIVGMVPLILLRWRMNLFTAGDDVAQSMGVNTNALRLVVILCSTLITAACVAISGLIGWIGLVIPHFCRMIFGSDNRRVLPASIIMGAAYLLLVDTVARTISTTEIPIGILTAVIGAPVFIYLMLSGGNKDGY